MKILPVVILALCLSGCAGLQFNDYEKYTQALSSHSTSESQRIQAQSDAIAVAATVPGTTKTEAVLLAAIAMMQIERLQPVPLGIAKPTTGYDVLDTVAGHIPFMSTTLGLIRLGESIADNAGNVIMNSDEIGVSDSFNRTSTTVAGTDNAVDVSADRDHSTTSTTTNTGTGPSPEPPFPEDPPVFP